MSRSKICVHGDGLRSVIVCYSAALALGAGAAQAGVISWLNPADGFWDVGTNWVGDAAPLAGDFAEIAVAGVYTVTVRSGRTVRGLFLTNPDAAVEIENFFFLSVLPQPGDTVAEVVNNGVIVVNSNQGTSTTSLTIGSGVAPGVLGAGAGSGGEVVLNVGDGNSDLSDARLTIAGGGLHGVNHTVRGKGQVLGEFTNDGLILADRENDELRILGDVTQGASGVARATAGGVLGISSGGIVRGGLLTTDDGGRIAVTAGTGTIEGGATLVGQADVLNFFTLAIGPGGIVNDGMILVNSNQSTSTTTVRVDAETTIGGAGSIDLNVGDGNSDLSDATLTTGTDITATNGPDHTVRGKGEVRGSWINEGLIQADRDGQELRITGHVAQTTQGVIGATSNAVLGISSGGRVSGGSVVTNDGGMVEVTAGTGTVDSGLHNLGQMGVRNGTALAIGDGGVVNDGATLVNSNQGTATTTVRVEAETTIGGAGSIDLNVSDGNSDLRDATLTTGTDITATNGPDHTIRGKGEVSGSWINEGLIQADRDGQELRITGHVAQTASGVIGATNNAVLGISSGGRVSGGSVVTSDGGTVEVTAGTGTVDSGLHNLGQMGVRNGMALAIGEGGVVNDGSILVNSNQGTAITVVRVEAETTIGGAGSIDLNVFDANSDLRDADLTTAEGVTATNGPDHTVRGKGQVTGAWINHGTIDADRAGQDLALIGTFAQTPGGTIMGSQGGFAILSGAEITGGFFDGQSGGAAHASSGINTISGVTNLGALGVRNAGSLHLLTGGLTNNGTLTINTSQGIATTAVTATESTTIDGDGLIFFNISPVNSDYNDAQLGAAEGEVLTIGPGQTVAGKGRLFGDVVLEGTLSPGSSLDTIRANATGGSGSLTMTASAEYRVEANGEESNDRLDATVPVHLAGTLRFTPIDGFDPPRPTRYTIVTGPEITGTFDELIYEGVVPPGGVFRVVYSATETIAAVTCEADIAPPIGILDLADITFFVSLFQQGSPLVDLAEPFGVLDLADIVAFVTAFGAGCGG